MLTTKIVNVATAFTRGSKPSLAREKMIIGIVEYPGPVKNSDKTTSSSDRVKVNNHADAKACVMLGKVTRKKLGKACTPDPWQPLQMTYSFPATEIE